MLIYIVMSVKTLKEWLKAKIIDPTFDFDLCINASQIFFSNLLVQQMLCSTWHNAVTE